jgi:hypothetical protein
MTWATFELAVARAVPIGPGGALAREGRCAAARGSACESIRSIMWLGVPLATSPGVHGSRSRASHSIRAAGCSGAGRPRLGYLFPHPEEPDGLLVAAPVQFDRELATLLRVAPRRAGEHTDEVFAELGVGAAELSKLRADGVIA